jgi:hypothetical protein
MAGHVVWCVGVQHDHRRLLFFASCADRFLKHHGQIDADLSQRRGLLHAADDEWCGLGLVVRECVDCSRFGSTMNVSEIQENM